MPKRTKAFRRVLIALLAVGGFALLRFAYQQYCDESLLDAIKRGDRASVQRFLAAGANPNVRGSMHRLVLFNEYVWQLIHRQSPDAGARYYGPALCAYVSQYKNTDVFDIPKEDPEITAALLRYGADIDAPDDHGITALGWAVTFRQHRTMRLLLEHGSNPDVLCYWKPGRILDQDANRQRLLLESSGPDPRRKQPALMTTFCVSPFRNDCNPEAARLLIAHGASANTVDSNGRTALMAAIYSGDGEAVQALIDRGADVNARIYGRTLLKIIHEGADDLYDPARRYCAASIQPLVKAGAKE